MCNCQFKSHDTVYQYHADVRIETSYGVFVDVDFEAGECSTLLDILEVLNECYSIVSARIDIEEVFPCPAENM